MDNDIQLKQKAFQGPGDGPKLLIVGGVHGDEYEPMVAIRRLIRQMPALKLHGQVTFIPCVNEEAYWRGHRTAGDGLDLARTCPGRPDGSTTERTADALSTLIRQSDFFIDLHTGGTVYDIFPLSGYCMIQNSGVLDAQRHMAQAFNLPLIWGTTPNLDGRSLSVARDAKVPAIYAEHGGRAGCNPAGAADYVEGCLGVMAELGMIERPRTQGRVRYVVEDTRDNSGHLQIQHPSPMAGYFEPAVSLGQKVKAGDVVGTVSDLMGDRVETVRALQTGLLLLLRSFPVVKENDALVAIAEMA